MCFKNRKIPSVIVSGLSVLVFILGLVLLTLACIYQTQKTAINTDMGDLNEAIKLFRDLTFAFILVFAIITLCVGGAGMGCTLKPCRQKPCGFAIAFGSCIMLIWVVFIVVGGIVTFVSTVEVDALARVCDTQDGVKLKEDVKDLE